MVSIISSLSKNDREILALCGVTQDAQLTRIDPAALEKDIAQALEFFPDSRLTPIPLERLAALCERAKSQAPQDAPEEEATPDGLPTRRGTALPSAAGKPTRRSHRHRRSTESEEAAATNDAATNDAAANDAAADGDKLSSNGEIIQLAQEASEDVKGSDPKDFNHAIRCTRPIAVYLGAWATLLLIAYIAAVVLCLIEVLLGVKFESKFLVRAGGAASIICLGAYFLMMRHALCSTCRMTIYSFRNYPRHRRAHYSALLGYTIPTALSVIFLFRFRCPACGTPQKLIGGHRHRHH